MATRAGPAPARSTPRARARRILALVRLPHPGPISLVLAATAGFALLAPGPPPTLATWLALLAAMLGGQVAIGALNELVDAPDDAVAKPWKPIPAGLVSVRTARLAVGAGLVAMVVGGAALGPASLALCSLGTGAGLLYDLRFKRSRFAWLPYLMALPLLPIWVWTSIDAFDPSLLLLYPLGTLAAIAVHLAQAAADADADRATGIQSLTTRLGARRSRRLSWGLVLATALAATIAAGPLGSRREVVIWFAAGAVLLICAAGILERFHPSLDRRTVFPSVAAACALLAFGWLFGLR